MSLLKDLAAQLETGRIRVVDLSQPLGPDTPVIGLPPQFGSSPGVSLEVISKFDDRGPAWYWNTIRMGEHTGTHFDAPIHWITGKELPGNACDTIPPRRFVGPACVIDASDEVARNPDYLLIPEHIVAWEAKHGKIPPRSWVLLRTDWSQRADAKDFLNLGPDGPHSPGFHRTASELLARDRDVLGVGGGDGRNRRRTGRNVRPAVPEPRDDAWRGEVRVGEPAEPRPAPGNRGDRDRRATQAGRRKRQPPASAGAGGGVVLHCRSHASPHSRLPAPPSASQG